MALMALADQIMEEDREILSALAKKQPHFRRPCAGRGLI